MQIKETNYQNLIKAIETREPNSTKETKYPGMIEIESVKIKNIIQYGTSEEILDNWFVGTVEPCKNLEQGPIILAGHNIPEVFRNLHQIQKNDKIKIKTSKGETTFQVTNIKKVKPYETESIKTSNPNLLILITCTEKDTKRLIIYAKKV